MQTARRRVFVLLIPVAIVLSACATTNTYSEPVRSVDYTPPLSTTPSASPRATPDSFTVVATGDILLHERTWTQAQKDGSPSNWDFYPQLADISAYTSSANFAMCHLETPLAEPGTKFTGYPIFNSPPQIMAAVKKLGFDFCEQTSNHSLDQGEAGILRTLDDLDEAGIAHTGSYRSQAESQIPTVIDVPTTHGTVKVGVVAAAYGFNGFDYPSGKTWLLNKINSTKLIKDALAARTAGAQVVIVHLHWGTEYSSKVSPEQRTIAQELADSGAVDLLVGDHAHVVQPIDKIGNMWVAYGHGNLVAAHREPESQKSEGLLTRWTFTQNPDGKFSISNVEYAPLLITDALPLRVLDVSHALSTNTYVSTTRSRLETALTRTQKIVTSLNTTATLLSR